MSSAVQVNASSSLEPRYSQFDAGACRVESNTTATWRRVTGLLSKILKSRAHVHGIPIQIYNRNKKNTSKNKTRRNHKCCPNVSVEMDGGVFVAGGSYACVHARAYVYCGVVAVGGWGWWLFGWGHNVRVTYRFCLNVTLAKNFCKRERPNFGTDASGSFHEQLHFRICQGKSQWAPRNTSLQKKKSHAQTIAGPAAHKCGDRRNHRDRTANTYARSRVRERKTHFNPNSSGVGSRALRHELQALLVGHSLTYLRCLFSMPETATL